MFLIVGLGNPGPKYEGTRHNVGFDMVDYLAKEYNLVFELSKKHQAFISKGIIEGKKVILVKPTTFMNLSGQAVRSIMQYYDLNNEDIIIAYDDISLDIGRIRIRENGSAGGHNGIKSIIASINTQEFNRVKIGVGDKPEYMDLADYVLSRFDKKDFEKIDNAIILASKATVFMLNNGVYETKNKFNGVRC